MFVFRRAGLEEAIGIGLVDQHGHTQLAGDLPDIGQAGIIYGDQITLGVAVGQSKSFEDFQPASAHAHVPTEQLDALGHKKLGVAEEGLVAGAAKAGLSEAVESAGIGTGKISEEVLELNFVAINSTGYPGNTIVRSQVAIAYHPGLVHDPHHVGGSAISPHVVVGINSWKASLLRNMLWPKEIANCFH